MDLPIALARISELERDNRALAEMVEDLGRKLEKAITALRGNRSEKLCPEELLDGCFEFMTQEELDLIGYSPSAEDPEDEEEEPAPRPRRKRKKTSTDHIEKRQTKVPVSPEDCSCPNCEKTMPIIGNVISEKWGYQPAVIYIMQYLLEKRACECGQGIAVAKMPKLPIEKGKAQPDLFSHVLVSKYLDGLPFYRQSKMFKRIGIEISNNTMGEWNRQVADFLEALYFILRQQVLAESYVQGDETGLREQKKGGCKKGWLWAYGRPRGQIFYDYQPDRSYDGPTQILEGYKGFLQADGYGAYKDIADASKYIVLIACWAHARRYFKDALPHSKMRAGKILKLIQKLYRIEQVSRKAEENFEQRQQRRQLEAPAILKSLEENMNAFQNEGNYLPKSKLGIAIGYSLRRWDQLKLYVEHGEIEIDNNLIENGMRMIAVARKNFLFVGSEEGGRRAAIFFSFLESCRRLEVNPYEYLKDILTRIPTTTLEDLGQLTPQNWKRAQEAEQVEAQPLAR